MLSLLFFRDPPQLLNWPMKDEEERKQMRKCLLLCELSLLDNSGVNHQWRAEFSAMARVTRLGLRRGAFCHLGS